MHFARFVHRVATSAIIASAAFAQAKESPNNFSFVNTDGAEITIVAEFQFKDSNELTTMRSQQLFIASNANGWDPQGTRAVIDISVRMRQLDRPSPLDGGFILPLAVASDPTFEFKFTRGSWETVEVGPDGRDIANRRLTNEQIEQAKLGKPIRLSIAGFADQRTLRWPELAKPASTVTGDLRTHDVTSTILANTRTIRVWLPPGYDATNAEARYPVLYMHDGQNCFDAATSFAGEWRIDETLTRLIGEGKVPPMIVVAIDNIGSERSNEYSPIDLGSLRPGTGGKGDLYLRFITEEVIPLINREYRTLTGSEHTAMGGSSLGGVITLHASMTRPDMFGAILVESPALWVGDGEFLRRVTEHKQWPARVFLAMGGREYGDAARDAALADQARQVEASMRAAGLDDARLRFVIDPDAGHNEPAWAARFPDAAEFLFGATR